MYIVQKRQSLTLFFVLIFCMYTDRQFYESLSLEEKRKLYTCGRSYVTLDNIQTWEEFRKTLSKCFFKLNCLKDNEGRMFLNKVYSSSCNFLVNLLPCMYSTFLYSNQRH